MRGADSPVSQRHGGTGRSSPGRRVVDVEQRLVDVGQVQVVLGFVVLGEGIVLRRRELAEWRQVRVHVGYVEAMRLVEVAIPAG